MVELLHKATVYDVPLWGKEYDDGMFCVKYLNDIEVIVVYLINAGLTHFMPLMVRDVAAMFVATTHFLIPEGGG